MLALILFRFVILPIEQDAVLSSGAANPVVEKLSGVVPSLDTWHEQQLQIACLMSLAETGKRL